jgi:predicted DNA-binding protein
MAKAIPSTAKPARARRRDPAHVLLRLPPHTKAELDALCGMTGMSISALVADAVSRYVDALPAAERRLLRGVKARRIKALTRGS